MSTARFVSQSSRAIRSTTDFNQPIKIKLFGCDSDEEIEREEYFESFFNLDLAAGFVFWNEKDPDYRAPLIRGLSVAG